MSTNLRTAIFVAAMRNRLAGDPRLRELLGSLPGLTGVAFADAMVEGVAQGLSPQQVARQVAAKVEGLPRSRALTIARTEVQSAYRQATITAWRGQGEAIEGWWWMSSQDRTTCAMCWAMHGTTHPLDDEMDTHANCRCTMVPIPNRALLPPGMEPPPIPSAEAAFSRLSEADQRAVLGRGKFDLYQAGAIRLDELVRRTDRGRREATLREVRREAEPPARVEAGAAPDAAWKLHNEGLSWSEVSERLGQPVSTVRAAAKRYEARQGKVGVVTPKKPVAPEKPPTPPGEGVPKVRKVAPEDVEATGIYIGPRDTLHAVTMDGRVIGYIREYESRTRVLAPGQRYAVGTNVRKAYSLYTAEDWRVVRATGAGGRPKPTRQIVTGLVTKTDAREHLVREFKQRQREPEAPKPPTPPAPKPSAPAKPAPSSALQEQIDIWQRERDLAESVGDSAGIARADAMLRQLRAEADIEAPVDSWLTPTGQYRFEDGDPVPHSHSPMGPSPKYTMVRGVRIVVDADLDLQAHAKRAAELLDTWPAAERANLRQMRFVSRFAKDRPGMKGDSIRATGSSHSGVITWWNQKAYGKLGQRPGKAHTLASQETFDHEMGHIVGDDGGAPSSLMWGDAVSIDRTAQRPFGYGTTKSVREAEEILEPDPGPAAAGITLRDSAPTHYGHTNDKEDWAESMLLFKYDQRHGQIGMLRDKAGNRRPARFAELWPERARKIEQHLARTAGRGRAEAAARPTTPGTRLLADKERLARLESERREALARGDRVTALNRQNEIRTLRAEMEARRNAPSPVRREPVTTEPPKLPWVEPPAPKGKGGRKAGGFTATGHTNTQMGDLAEALVAKLDMRSLLPEGHRQNPLDSEWDGSGWGFEIKAVTTRSTEYKARMKAHEVDEKIAYAASHNLEAGTMMVVMDLDAMKAYVYWRPGIRSARLSEKQWNHMGVVDITEADLSAMLRKSTVL